MDLLGCIVRAYFDRDQLLSYTVLFRFWGLLPALLVWQYLLSLKLPLGPGGVLQNNS